MIYKKPLDKLSKLFFHIYAWQLKRSYPNYQPIFYNGKLITRSERHCLDRWNLIKKEIIAYKAKSVLDLGCAEGFYVLQSAKECNCLALGVDADIRRLALAQIQIVSEKIGPAGFLFGLINEDLIKRLPEFDLVIFMSVMHHMMYSQGEDYSRNFLRQLRAKVGKVMIFEMGQSNEQSEWAKKLPDMKNNPHEWIKNFLLSAGFSSVVKIGESDSYRKDQRRAIFRVEP